LNDIANADTTQRTKERIAMRRQYRISAIPRHGGSGQVTRSAFERIRVGALKDHRRKTEPRDLQPADHIADRRRCGSRAGRSVAAFQFASATTLAKPGFYAELNPVADVENCERPKEPLHCFPHNVPCHRNACTLP